MKKLLIGTALAVFAANAADATVFTQTWTGTVFSGVDSANVFGGGNLAGQTFVATYVFDDSIGVVTNTGTQHSAHGGAVYPLPTPNLSASLTIKGVTYSFVGTQYGDILALQESGFSQVTSAARSATAYLTNSVYDFSVAAFADLSFNYSGSVPSTGSGSTGQFEYGGEKLLFKNQTYSISAAVPEPASWAMMIGGFALVGSAMRRKRPAVRFA